MTRTIHLLCILLLWGALATPLHAESLDPLPGEGAQILQSKDSTRGFVVVDGRSYQVTPSTRVQDAWGNEIGLADLPVPEGSASGENPGEMDVGVQIRVAPGDGPARLLELRYLPSLAH